MISIFSNISLLYSSMSQSVCCAAQLALAKCSPDAQSMPHLPHGALPRQSLEALPAPLGSAQAWHLLWQLPWLYHYRSTASGPGPFLQFPAHQPGYYTIPHLLPPHPLVQKPPDNGVPCPSIKSRRMHMVDAKYKSWWKAEFSALGKTMILKPPVC